MPGPKAIVINLSEAAVSGLTKLSKTHHTGQQIVLRMRIILAMNQGHSNSQIARELGVDVETVQMWRKRWQMLEPIPLSDLSTEERLEDLARLARQPGLRRTNAAKPKRWLVNNRKNQAGRSATGPTRKSRLN